MTIQYKCDYCGWNHFQTAEDCLNHEQNCNANPNLKSCGTCANSKRYFGAVSPYMYDCIPKHKDNSKLTVKKNCDYWTKQTLKTTIKE